MLGTKLIKKPEYARRMNSLPFTPVLGKGGELELLIYKHKFNLLVLLKPGGMSHMSGLLKSVSIFYLGRIEWSKGEGK